MQSSVNASKWVFWAQESGHLFLLQKVSCEVSCLTPLYILQVTLAGPRTTVEAQAFYRMYHSYADIPVEDILDDYTLFLHRGGGAFLRRYREAKGWSRQQLADHAKVSRTSIRCWESGQKTISQKCFCHLVENLGSDFPSMLRM